MSKNNIIDSIKISELVTESFEETKNRFGKLFLLWMAAFLAVLFATVATMGIGAIFVTPLLTAGALIGTKKILAGDQKVGVSELIAHTGKYKDCLILTVTFLGPFIAASILSGSGTPIFVSLIIMALQTVAQTVLEVSLLSVIEHKTNFKSVRDQMINLFMSNIALFATIAAVKSLIMLCGGLLFIVGLVFAVPQSAVVTILFYKKLKEQGLVAPDLTSA